MVLTMKLCLTSSAFCLVATLIVATSADISELTPKIPRTKFSCKGRPSGYYADVDTGCTVYHMCDESGRQFTNRCPNATLFQQRMLICDHWYMVKCESSEKDYKANLLIGQRDALFVTEEEKFHENRTPRPDLFDRPYAHDYSGESFRRQFKLANNPPIQNQIVIEQPRAFTPRKKYTPNDIFLESESTHGAKPIIEQANNIIQEIQKTIEENTPSVDASVIAQPVEEPSPLSNTVINEEPEVVPPSKYYSPPFLEPIYNQEYHQESNDTSSSSNESKLDRRQSTNERQTAKYDFKPFDSILKAVRNASRDDYDFSKYIVNRTRQNTTKSPKKAASTTFRTRPTRPLPTIQNPSGFKLAQSPAPFSVSSSTRTVTSTRARSTTTTTRRTPRPTIRLSLPTIPPTTPSTTTTTTTTTTTPQPPSPHQFVNPIEILSNSIQKPSVDLLPPFEELTHHDGVTLGPPIYYEWKSKMPSLDILPPFLDSELKDDVQAAHSQTTRSISNTNIQDNSLEGALKNLMKTNYDALKEKFSIPQFDFPLENEIVRTGYENSDAVNSFQLKIPRDVSKIEWYGENLSCPECHPAFVRPGSCEPCVRIKQ